MQHRFCKRTRKSGFTLVELSIVLVILGIVLAGGLVVGTSVVDRQAIISTNSQMDEVTTALKAYYAINNRLPCVAPLTTAVGAAGFGTEITPGAATCSTNTTVPAGTYRVAGTGARQVRIGAVPVRTLGMRDRYIADEFGNRYLYAVTELHTASAGFTANDGAIIVQDNNGTAIVSNSSYILVSHGPDGKGAYRFQTGAASATACTANAATPLDSTNCAVDSPASSVDATFRDARFNNGSQVASFFDDFTRWQQKALLVAGASATGAAGNLWNNTGDDIFSVGNDSSTATGNVGIGTATPSSKLHVRTDANLSTGSLTVASPDSSTMMFAPDAAVGNWSPLTQSSDSALIFHSGAIDTGALTIGQWSASARGMRITSTGNVGIGTASPSTTLSVYNGNETAALTGVTQSLTSSGINIVTDYTANNYTPGVFWSTANDNPTRPKAGIWLQETGSGTLMQFGTSNSYATGITNEALTIIPSGRVGIGTNAPTEVLEVNGFVYAQDYFIPSDKRLKHDIAPLFDGAALATLEKIRAVSFKWNKDNKPDAGVIAQEVESVFPQAVRTATNGFKRVAYDKLVLPLIEAVKELHALVKSVIARLDSVENKQAEAEAKIAALQKENAALTLRLERLEQTMYKQTVTETDPRRKPQQHTPPRKGD
jgi:prepilin-type N-terminal cleavage/methylation domain-containing protein